MDADTPLKEYIPRVTKTRLAGFERLGLHTILDLLYHFPSHYTDTVQGSGAELVKGTTVSFTGTLTKLAMKRTPKKKLMIADGSLAVDGVANRISLIWYNQPYIAKQYTKGDVVSVTGVVGYRGNKAYLTNPIIKPATALPAPLELSSSVTDEPVSAEGEPVPVYPETANISSMYLRSLVPKILSESYIQNIPDPIPETIRTKLNLPSRFQAFAYIHTPRNQKETIIAKKRFVFEKVFALQLDQRMNKNRRQAAQAYTLSADINAVEQFMKERFEFTPTTGQERAVREIIGDINKNIPMTRLLEGDVGSGKTAVVAAVIYGILSAEKEEKTSGKPQIVYLAPTEILAHQQFETLTSLFSNLPIQVGLITSKACLKYPSKLDSNEPTTISKNKLKERVANGEIAVVVGTHALLQKNISFKRLALGVVDEQHRFGVAQRKLLLEMGGACQPHLLSMTATPIPRTLALALYADLDISVIDTMPKERKAVKTKLLEQKTISTAYEHIRQEVEQKHQAYVICPLVEENEELKLRSVAEEYAHLSKNIFPEYTVGYLHGKMKPKEKQEVMEQFAGGSIDILVSTIVVEVGINVPNATIITILHAERFGLAQLHQLRGRVQRSIHQPFCYAVTDSTGESTLERLKEFEKTHDGFRLAEKDLAMRGSGELGGLKQSGIPDLIWEGLKNQKLLAIAQQEASDLLESDPTLEQHPDLKKCVTRESLQGD